MHISASFFAIQKMNTVERICGSGTDGAECLRGEPSSPVVKTMVRWMNQMNYDTNGTFLFQITCCNVTFKYA